jgi:hypothetical protein
MSASDSIVETLVKVQLKEPSDFLKVKETLTRIGFASKKENILFQSCHILHKRGSYYIVHFKELFLLDGKKTDLSQNDIGRRNTIARLLADWGLVVIEDPEKIKEPTVSMNQIKVVPYREKSNWQLQPKYAIGNG